MNDKNLMKAINCRVIPVAGYIMNVCNLGKGDLDELDMIVKSVLWREGFHGRQPSDERLCSERNEGGRGLKSFKEVYDETKTRVACYMAAARNKWIRAAWRNEIQKEQISLKKEAEKAIRKVEVIASFDEGSVVIGEESYTEWKERWEKLKNILNEGQIKNKQQSLAEKELQSEIPKHYSEEDSGRLKCNTEPRKASSIFALQDQMIETRAWKKRRGLVECDKCRLCGEHRETVHHLPSRLRAKSQQEQSMSNDTTIL